MQSDGVERKSHTNDECFFFHHGRHATKKKTLAEIQWNVTESRLMMIFLYYFRNVFFGNAVAVGSLARAPHHLSLSIFVVSRRGAAAILALKRSQLQAKKSNGHATHMTLEEAWTKRIILNRTLLELKQLLEATSCSS
jgi:hypothetical protein